MLLAIFLAIPEYVRDVLVLPLFGDRILYVDFYLGLLALILCLLQTRRRASLAGAPDPAGTQSSNAVLYGIALFSLVFFAAAFFHGATAFFVPLQASVFAVSLATLSVLVRHGYLPELARKMNVALAILIVVQSAVVAAGQVMPLPAELSAPRNLWPYAAMLAYVVNLHVGSGAARRVAFVETLLLIAINSTKGAIILLAIVIVVHWLRRPVRARPWMKAAVAGGIVTAVVIAHIVIYYYGMEVLLIRSLAELEHLGTLQRSMVDNQIGSLISRVFSVPYTLMIVIERDALAGLGEVAAGRITFWGYPVHNLFISYIAVFGVIGLAFSIAYMVTCFLIARASLALFAIAFFLPLVANDFYAVLAMCLAPLLIPAGTALEAAQRLRGPPVLPDRRAARSTPDGRPLDAYGLE